MPQSSWSSPEPCTYAKPPTRRPVPAPASVWRDADTQMTGTNVRSGSGGSRGKADVAGVIQSGRSGCGRSGRTYAESCQPVNQTKILTGGEGRTYEQGACPAVDARGDLRVLLRADRPGRGV